MRGPTILARTLSVAKQRGVATDCWQYHSRGDNHSQVASWCLLFDLLLECDAVSEAASRGRIRFSIHHKMVGLIDKTLDLAVWLVQPEGPPTKREPFSEVAGRLGVVLDNDDRRRLSSLPRIEHWGTMESSELAIAVETQAFMTNHVRSMPRLHSRILATGYLVRKASPRCITSSYSLINAAPNFVLPSGTGKTIVHRQPEDTRRVAEMVGTGVPTVSDGNEYGYDAVGISVIDCRNDGTPVSLVDDLTMPYGLAERVSYGRMVGTICSEFRKRFAC